MSTQMNIVNNSNIPYPVHNFSDVVGISILDTEDKAKGKDENTILDFIRECNKKEGIKTEDSEKTKS